MNVVHKARLHDLLIANGLPVRDLYNDHLNNLAMTWTQDPTPLQLATATSLANAFDDSPQAEDKLLAAGGINIFALALKVSPQFTNMTAGEQTTINNIIQRDVARIIAALRA